MAIRISAISYLNTLPFVYGLKCSSLYPNSIDLILSTPEKAARDLINRTIDIGIVPSAIIPQLGKERIISDYCIGAEGKVASVLLCSGKPVSEIEEVFLDCESTTSVLLARILFRRHWRIEPSYSLFNAGLQEIDYSLSYLLIGDKALLNGRKFKFVYDLAEEWIKFKSLPFVFACWTSNRNLSDSFKIEFNKALEFGVNNIENSISTIPLGFDYNYVLDYLTNNVSYKLTPEKREGLSEFWTLAMEELKSKVRWFG